MLESLKKKLKMLDKTKEHWEETKTYIQVKVFFFLTMTYKYRRIQTVLPVKSFSGEGDFPYLIQKQENVVIIQTAKPTGTNL